MNTTQKPAFHYLSLGAGGGVDGSDLTGHLFAPINSNDYICVDSGNIYHGLVRAHENGHLESKLSPEGNVDMTVEGRFLHENIKAYLVTHTYLDHMSGLVQISPNDSPKPLLSLPETIDGIRDHVFNGIAWPNFGNEGVEPQLGLYSYQRLEPQVKTSIPGSEITVEAHRLFRSAPIDSAAYILEHDGQYIVFFGDTGPDSLNERKSLQKIWKRIAPLIRKDLVKAIFMECSYPDSRPADLLYSHMKPSLFMESFADLAQEVSSATPDRALKGLKVFVTHIKPHFDIGESARNLVEQQLNAQNRLGLDIHIVTQGMAQYL